MKTRMEQASVGLIIRLLWGACLALGTSSHVLAIVQHGWASDYGGMPIPTRVFWTSLTGLDPLTAILLLIRPRFGIIFTGCIMVADVWHNTWALLTFGGRINLFLILQVAFLLFVVATASLAWRTAPGTPAKTR